MTMTYGAAAARVREAMKLMDVPESDQAKVWELVRCACGSGASTTEVWAIAALIVPDCTKLPPIDEEWTPAWPDRVTPETVAAMRRLVAGGAQWA